jgi:hypothetical protein
MNPAILALHSAAIDAEIRGYAHYAAALRALIASLQK